MQGRAKVGDKLSQLRPEEPGDEEQRGAPQPQTEPGPADREGARGTLRGSIKGGREQEKQISTHLSKSAAS